MRKILLIGLCGWAAAAGVFAASPSDLLERAIYAEETKGELQTASRLYQEILNDAGASRAVQAQAQLRLALVELKLGDKTRATAAVEALSLQFADKAGLLEALGKQVPSVLDDMIKKIEQNYIADVNRGEIVETALRAIIGKLDSGATFLREKDLQYLTPEDLLRLNESMDQKFAGIGAVLVFDEAMRAVSVKSTIANSPAFKADLREGDQILEVDGLKLPAGKELESAVRLLRGPVGTTVAALTQRGEIRFVRDTVKLPSVKASMADPESKIALVRLNQFGKETVGELEAALAELQPRALILDLRGCPGGLLSEAVRVADLFLESGRITTVKSRSGEQHHDATPGGVTALPMVVLVNHDTASAAEIVAAALQDNGRAVVVGERTFGQALVKSIVPLKEGLGALKLPTAAYYRPNGRNMNRYPDSAATDDWGVTPNEGQEVSTEDGQLQRALGLLKSP